MLLLVLTVAYYFMMPVAEVASVRRGAAISAVYGTVRIEPAFVVHVRAQNSGFIQLAEAFSAGRGAIGKSVKKMKVAMMNGSRPYLSAKYAVGISAAVATIISIAVRTPTFVALTCTVSIA